MAKENREKAWLQCTVCSDLNYRTEIKVAGGAPKIELKKYCKRERKHTVHKLKSQEPEAGRNSILAPGYWLLSPPPYAGSSIGRAAVSKAAGYRFDSYPACCL